MSMPIINFDEHFADFMSEWMKEHQDQYENFDAMEEDIPRIYVAFLNKRAGWLGNVTPGSYFTQFEDPKVLVDWMRQYCEENVPVPDLLPFSQQSGSCFHLIKQELLPRDGRFVT